MTVNASLSPRPHSSPTADGLHPETIATRIIAAIRASTPVRRIIAVGIYHAMLSGSAPAVACTALLWSAVGNLLGACATELRYDGDSRADYFAALSRSAYRMSSGARQVVGARGKLPRGRVIDVVSAEVA